MQWHKNRDARDQRIEAGRKLSAGKIVEAQDATRLLEAVIRKGDRVCLEGDYQKGRPAQLGPSGSKYGARLLSGIDGASVSRLDQGLDKLAAQISYTVRWADNLQDCVENGAMTLLELGPGRALSEMATTSYPDIPSRSLDDFKTLDGARAWISRWTSR